jgi:hypothetical protein
MREAESRKGSMAMVLPTVADGAEPGTPALT